MQLLSFKFLSTWSWLSSCAVSTVNYTDFLMLTQPCILGTHLIWSVICPCKRTCVLSVCWNFSNLVLTGMNVNSTQEAKGKRILSSSNSPSYIVKCRGAHPHLHKGNKTHSRSLGVNGTFLFFGLESGHCRPYGCKAVGIWFSFPIKICNATQVTYILFSLWKIS